MLSLRSLQVLSKPNYHNAFCTLSLCNFHTETNNFNLLQHTTTCFSTLSKNSSSIDSDKDDSQTISNVDAANTRSQCTLLYKRHTSKARFPRMLLSLSTIHTAYWTWYVCDFTPFLQQRIDSIDSTLSNTTNTVTNTMNSDAMQTITSSSATSYIDNTIVGYIGLGLAIVMSAGSFIYPLSLIQEIQLVNRDDNNSSNSQSTSNHKKQSSSQYNILSPTSILQIKTYSLPFITPSSNFKSYNLGDVIFDSPNDVKTIITDYQNDISRYEGYLPLHAKGRRINLLLQLTPSSSSSSSPKEHNEKEKDDDVYHQDLLLYSLVTPELRNVLHMDRNKMSSNQVRKKNNIDSSMSLNKQKKRNKMKSSRKK